jgi:hypothetical protein
MAVDITSCVLSRLSRYEKVSTYRAGHNGATSLDTTATGVFQRMTPTPRDTPILPSDASATDTGCDLRGITTALVKP